jgi:tetrahydromethanopterin S-methyltransferase subunit G
MPFDFDGTSGHFDTCVSHYTGKKNKRTGKNFTKKEASKMCAVIMRKQETKSFAEFAEPMEIFAEDFEYIKSDSGDFYVNFYLTTDDVDKVNDMVTTECQEDIVRQLQGRDISIKMGVEHDVYLVNDKRLLPHAKITEAKRISEQGKSRVKATAILNKHHPDFNSVKGSIIDGFLDATSIEYKPVEFVHRNISGKTVRLLNKILLKGVTFTGRPINEAAKILDFFVKSQDMYDKWESKGEEDEPEEPNDIEECPTCHGVGTIEKVPVNNEMEVTTMPEEKEDAKAETPKEEQKTEAPKVEVKTEEMVTISKKEFDEMKSKLAELEVKAQQISLDTVKSMVIEAMKDYKPEVKSLVEQKEKFPENTEEFKTDTKSMIQRAFGKI